MGRIRPISSRDRLRYDVSKAIKLGYHDFFESALAQELRIPRRFFGPSRGHYHKALEIMLERVNIRLQREGMSVDRPKFTERLFNRGKISYEGYRNYLYDLPVRIAVTGRCLGTLKVEMAAYQKHFEIPIPPKAILNLNQTRLKP